MPQGLRGRVALIGAGVVFCSGLVGCLTAEKAKGPPPVSRAKNGVVTPPGAKTTTPDIRPVGGSGIPTGGGFQQGTVPPGGFQPGSPTPGYTGGINAPVVPGNYGAGAPLPGQSPVVPSLTPPPSNYPPQAGAAVPPGFGSSNTPALPTTARAAAPTTFPAAPPTPMLTEAPPMPPAPPTGATPGDVTPPTAPAGIPGPLAPPAPFAPTR